MEAQGISEKIEDFFAGNTSQIALFNAVGQLIQSIGAASVVVTKSQIAFGAPKKFAWVWLPLKNSKKRPVGCVVLSFSLHRHLVSKRIAEAVEPYPNRWMHHLILQHESELDDEVRQWLEEAFGQGR
jgi:hypothetical protein